jgi:4-amino-4-deoxy-L-arabinose transferase-like glycosyltransferase
MTDEILVISSRSRRTLVAVAAIGLALRIPMLFGSIAVHHGWRQSQTAWTIRQYARYPVDLLRPEVPIFGFRSVVVYEFPLYQFVASLLARGGASVVLAGRIINLLSFVVVTCLTFLVARRIIGKDGALVAASILWLSPFSVYWSTSVMIEYFVLVFVLLLVWSLFKWRENDQLRWLAIGVGCSVASGTIKLTTLVVWMPVCVAVIVFSKLSWAKRVFGVASVAVAGLGSGVAWTMWADHVKTRQVLVSPLSSEGLMAQNRQVLANFSYAKVLARPIWSISGQQLGLIGLIALGGAFVALVQRNIPVKDRLVMAALLGMPLLAVVVFPIQYGEHDYYSAAVSPAVALAAAFGGRFLWKKFADRLQPFLVPGVRRIALFGPAILVASLAGFGLFSFGYLSNSFAVVKGYKTMAEEIRIASNPAEVVGFSANTWDPLVLFLADRNGIQDWARTDASLAAWNAQSISTLVVETETSLLHGLTAPILGAKSAHVIKLSDDVDGLQGAAMRSFRSRPRSIPQREPEALTWNKCGRSGIELPVGETVGVVVRGNIRVLLRVNELVSLPAREWVEVDTTKLDPGSRLFCRSDAPVEVSFVSPR